MSKLGINTGSSPNDGQGDSLRVAMGKINHNFTEIYDTFGDGNTIVSYAGTAGISTVAENLTGRPRVEVSGILNTGITTTEHIEVRNITSTGIITAVQFIGDGSQISNVVAEWSGIDVLDDNVRKGVARELNFGDGLFVGPPDGRGRVLVALTTSVVSSGGTGGGGTPLEFRNQDVVLGEYSKLNFGKNLYAEANLLTGIVSVTTAPGGIDISGIVTASAFVGDGSGLTNIIADGEWKNINLPGGFFGDYGQPLGIHTSKHVGIGRTADSATVLYVEASTVGSAGTPYGLRVDGFANINNVRFDYTTEGYTRFLFPSSQTIVGGDGNGYYSALQYNQLTSTPFHIRSHSKFTRTVQIGTSFYDLGDGPILYPGIFMDGGTATIAVGLGITINGGTGIITATGFSGGAGGVNVSGTVTATSFSGDGSGLTGIASEGYVNSGLDLKANLSGAVFTGVSTFNNTIIGSPTSNVIPFLYAEYGDLPSPSTYHGAFAHVHGTNKAYFAHSAAWVELVNRNADTTVGTSTDNYLVGVLTATTLYGDGSNLTGLSTFSGDYNDLSNKPTIPVNLSDLANVNAGGPNTGQVLKWSGTEWTAAADATASGGVGIGLSDLSVTISAAGINSLTYNDTTGVFNFTPTSLVGYATESYVDNLVAISTFSGDYNDLINQPDIPSIAGLASEGYVDTQIGIRTFSGNYNDLTNQPVIPSIVGLASEGYVDSAVAGVSTFSGDYNDLTNKPVGLATEGYVDTQIGIRTFSGNYNDLTNQPSIPSIAGLASEGYVDTAVAGINTFTGAATTITSTQIGNWDTAYSWGNHASQGYLTDVNISAGANIDVVETSEGNFIITATSSGSVGSGGTWSVNASGIHTSKNVGIGTEISNSTLWVEGDGYFSGVVTATRFESTSAGTPTIDSPNNLNINAVTVAISTDLTVGGSIVGGGQTINSTGVQVTGVVTATSFVGDGSNLTGISFAETDTLASVTIRGNTTSDNIIANYYENNSTTGDGSDRGYCIKYYVTANGTSAFRFAGPGLLNTTDNPTFYLQRGFTYIFENSTGTAHPFRIQFVGTTIGVGTYVSGSQTGTQYFTIPFDAPSSYEYQCTLHGGMLGTFNVA